VRGFSESLRGISDRIALSLGTPNRGRRRPAAVCGFIYLLALAVTVVAGAQDSDSVPLGDLARGFRKKPANAQKVIDNDNMSQVLDEAELQRRSGSQLTFSVDPAANQFRVSSPDVTCSLSFSSNATALIADPPSLQEFPAAELAKLDGPAVIDGDALQITLSNGSQWSVHELTISLTMVRYSDPSVTAAYFGSARLLPAASGDTSQAIPAEKRRDVTVLYKVHRDVKAAATAVLRTSLTDPPGPGQEWHWAIVRAKGSPPPAPSNAATTAPTADTMPASAAPLPAQRR
jgi:hypothetical protein